MDATRRGFVSGAACAALGWVSGFFTSRAAAPAARGNLVELPDGSVQLNKFRLEPVVAEFEFQGDRYQMLQPKPGEPYEPEKFMEWAKNTAFFLLQLDHEERCSRLEALSQSDPVFHILVDQELQLLRFSPEYVRGVSGLKHPVFDDFEVEPSLMQQIIRDFTPEPGSGWENMFPINSTPKA